MDEVCGLPAIWRSPLKRLWLRQERRQKCQYTFIADRGMSVDVAQQKEWTWVKVPSSMAGEDRRWTSKLRQTNPALLDSSVQTFAIDILVSMLVHRCTGAHRDTRAAGARASFLRLSPSNLSACY